MGVDGRERLTHVQLWSKDVPVTLDLLHSISSWSQEWGQSSPRADFHCVTRLGTPSRGVPRRVRGAQEVVHLTPPPSFFGDEALPAL